MDFVTTSQFISSRQLVENIWGVRIIPALKAKIRQCPLIIVQSGTPDIMLDHVLNIYDSGSRLTCLINIANVTLFGDI